MLTSLIPSLFRSASLLWGALSLRGGARGGVWWGASSPEVTISLSAELRRRRLDCDVVRARPLRLNKKIFYANIQLKDTIVMLEHLNK